MEVNKLNGITPPSAVTPVTGEPKLQANPELVQAVAAVNGAKLFGYDSELTFAMDRETRRMVVRLIEKDTRKVIRQIPPEYLLRLAEGVGGRTE